MTVVNSDNFLTTDKYENYVFSVFSTIGNRNEQQDSCCYIKGNGYLYMAVCDGMGGTNAGSVAGRTAAEYLDSALLQMNDVDFESDESVCIKLTEIASEADKEVCSLTDEAGEKLNSGTTLASVLICNNKLFWLSVGDSRVYIIRGRQIVQVTTDHNYKLALQENMNAGLIDRSFVDSESSKDEALISYLGMGNISLIDVNRQAFKLLEGDSVLIVSDGMYRYINDSDIMFCVSNALNTEAALRLIDTKIGIKARNENINRDNMTAVLIKCLDEGVLNYAD